LAINLRENYMAQTNHRRLAVAIAAAYIADIVFMMFYHCYLLGDTYMSFSGLWRNEQDMQQFSPYIYLGHFILVAIAGVTFSRGYENKGLLEGFRFGLLLGLILASQTIIAFAFLPISSFLFNAWLLGSLLEGSVIGIILASAYTIKLADEKAPKKAASKKKK
jgi:hypothetical protein